MNNHPVFVTNCTLQPIVFYRTVWNILCPGMCHVVVIFFSYPVFQLDFPTQIINTHGIFCISNFFNVPSNRVLVLFVSFFSFFCIYGVLKV